MTIGIGVLASEGEGIQPNRLVLISKVIQGGTQRYGSIMDEIEFSPLSKKLGCQGF